MEPKKRWGCIRFELRGKHTYMALMGRYYTASDARAKAAACGGKIIDIDEYDLYKGDKFEYIPLPDTALNEPEPL
jgi:hypothetical protein